ncbi:MAG: hypothetical protein JZD40_04465 [Sulfolobus sp.]|nr:hypothetical protein [Sulfolobus sp.]
MTSTTTVLNTTITNATTTTTTTHTTTIVHTSAGLMPQTFWYYSMGFVIAVGIILIIFGFLTWRSTVPVKIGKPSSSKKKKK